MHRFSGPRCAEALQAALLSGWQIRHVQQAAVQDMGRYAASKAFVVGPRQAARLSGWQIGKTRVFLRAGQLAQLEGARGRRLTASAVTIQARARRGSGRTKVNVEICHGMQSTKALCSRLVDFAQIMPLHIGAQTGTCECTLPHALVSSRPCLGSG